MANNVPSAHGSGRGLGREGYVIDNEDRTAKRSRLRVRHLLPLALLALMAVLLVPTGGATRPPMTKFEICVQNATTNLPTCGGVATSTFDGNTVATVNVAVENDGSSTTALQSANINVPDQLKVVSGSGLPTDNVTVSGQQIQVRGIKVQPGKSFTASFQVDVACGGQFPWPAQQAASGDNLTGTPFDYQSGSSTGVTTSITTTATIGCHLGFVTQPTDTATESTITDVGASKGGPIKVGLFVGTSTTPMTTCPVGYATCSVDIDSAPVGVNTETQPLDSSLVASFSDLSISIPSSDVADQFNLVASGHGSFAPAVTSSSFLIAQTVTALQCPGNSCTTGSGHQVVSGSNLNLADSFVDVSSSNGFTFMTLSPFTLVNAQPHAGCQGLQPLNVTGFAESDSRLPGSGTLAIRYYVNKDILSARYGKNVGNQFAPMCVGARPVDTVTGAIHDCSDQGPWNNGPWLGDGITSTGKFTGKSALAVCDTDGYYWGIISSYQDKLDATANPTVTNWGGTQINGDNYRFFDMSIPPGWDWRSGP